MDVEVAIDTGMTNRADVRIVHGGHPARPIIPADKCKGNRPNTASIYRVLVEHVK